MIIQEQCNDTACATESTALQAQPPADIFETDVDYRIAVDMPGVSQERVQVRVEEGTLEVSGAFESLSPQGTVERPFDALQFKRVFRIGEQVNADAIEATVRQGALTVVLPKVEKAKPRNIDINAG